VSVAQEQSAWLVAAGQPGAVRRTAVCWLRMQARVGGGEPFRNARRLCATRYDPMDVGTAVGLGGRTGGTGRGGEAVVWIRWRVVCCITWYWYSSTRSYGQSSGTALGQLPPTLRLLWLLLLSQDPRAPCTYCCCCSAVLLLDKRALVLRQDGRRQCQNKSAVASRAGRSVYQPHWCSQPAAHSPAIRTGSSVQIP
jgi:hypothetical protein